MNSAAKALVSFVAGCCFLAAGFFLRVIPSANIWPEYQMVYFPQEADLSFLTESSVKNLFPGLLSQVSAVRSDTLPAPDFTTGDPVYRGMYLSVVSPFSRDGFDSDSIRSFFFTDKNGQYQIVYVPQDSFKAFCSLLDSRKMTYGTDSTVKVPYGGGITVIVLACILILLVRPPVLHVLLLVPLVCCSFFAPSYTVNCLICAVLGLFSFVDCYWTRMKGVLLFFRNPFCIALLVLVLVLMAMTPYTLLAVVLVCLLSSVAFGLAVRFQEYWARSTRHFTFTPIISGAFVRMDEKKKTCTVVLFSAAVLAILGLSLGTAAGSTIAGEQDLSLPGPVRYTESIRTLDGWDEYTGSHEGIRYPDYSDFVAELWQRQAYPYRQLPSGAESSPGRGSTVSVRHFVEDETGVHEIQKDVLVFDDAYLSNSADWITEHDSVADFLVRQNSAASTTYTTTGAFTITAADYTGIFVSIAAAACLCMVLLIRRARQRSSDR